MRKLYVEKHIEIQQWIITQMDQAKFRQASPQCGPLNEERTDSLTSQIRMVALLCLCERAGSWEERDSVRPSIRPSTHLSVSSLARGDLHPKRLQRGLSGGERDGEGEAREGTTERGGRAEESGKPGIAPTHPCPPATSDEIRKFHSGLRHGRMEISPLSVLGKIRMYGV